MRKMTMTDLKYANRYGYTDVEPYEIVRVISDLTVEVRAMRAERDESVKLNHIPGGFFAHCSNQQDQKWFITSDESAPVERIRYSRAKRQWQNAYGSRFQLVDIPRKFYDYNF
jgi:hypothetical protein